MVDHRVVLRFCSTGGMVVLKVPVVARRLAADVVEAHLMLQLLLFQRLERLERVCGHPVSARELVRRQLLYRGRRHLVHVLQL